MKGMFKYEGAYTFSDGKGRTPFRETLGELQFEKIHGRCDIGEAIQDTFVAPLEFFMVT